jgi:anaerobic selenocysteine-containing dehydrogenase
MDMEILKTLISRRRFLQASGAAGAAGAAGFGLKTLAPVTVSEAQAQQAAGATTITKNNCGQCPGRCGIDVYTTNGRVHAIYGTVDHPISNGKLCPKGHLGTYILYDPDRFKGPMKRTNPKKGRNEDPKFVPISWDEAFNTIAARLQALRDKGESHRFAFLFGRGWGATDVGLYGPFGTMYGTPNRPIGHSSMCADASMFSREAQEGVNTYHSMDYLNCNYLLNFGASFLEAFRPYTYLMQAWGGMRSKSPRTRVTVVEVRMSTTAAAADRALIVKPGTDGALALAIAHVLLTEGLWEKAFVGDFADGANRFKAGEAVNPVFTEEDAARAKEALKQAREKLAAAAVAVAAAAPAKPAAAPTPAKPAAAPARPAPTAEERLVEITQSGKPVFNEKWTRGLIEWWNAELKDRTPQWAAGVCEIPERDIIAVARELGTTRPAMVIQERGVGSHFNGSYSAMAVNALNALAGASFAKGGVMHQMGAPYGKLPVDYTQFLDDYAKSDERKKPRIDLARAAGHRPLAKNAMQDVAKNHLAGKPYKLDTAWFHMTNPIWTGADSKIWEEALKDVFVIETSPVASETAAYADLVIPEHTYLERLQVVADQPVHGYPQAHLRTPAIKPLYDTRDYADMIIEIGKRMKGPMGDYYKAIGNHENLIRHLAKGWEANPGDNGVNSFESWKEKGVWYKKPYKWQQRNGEFFEWDGKGYNKPMTPEDVKAKLLKTASGKFEFKSARLEKEAEFVNKVMGVAPEKAGFPQWIAPRHTGGGDLHFVTPKTAMHAEGRSANLPHAIALQQPSVGGRNTVFLEIHPETAGKRGIRNGDKVRIKSSVGAIEAYARHSGGVRPDTVVLPMEHGHWGQGRWANGRLPGNTNEVTANESDPISGLLSYYTGKVSVERA